MNRRAVIALALVIAACSGAAAETTTTSTATTTTSTTTTTTTSTTTTTTTLPPTTTTTLDPSLITIAPEGFRSAVNGLPADTLVDRRAIAVKVDNHPDARPQSGIQEADGVIETLVEGGFTRFIAVYHTTDSSHVGPIRSLRPTDSTLLPLVGPIAISGGQAWVQSLANSRGIGLIGEGTVGLFRIGTRVAPHNLYGDTERIRITADARSYGDTAPEWLYALGEWRIPDEPAKTVTMSWSNFQVVTWKYRNGQYHRWYGDTPHEWVATDGTRGQITADVLVVLAGDRYEAFPPGADGTPVPAIDTVGSGDAWVISRGGVWTGTWERDAIGDRFVLRNGDGSEAVVPPGFVWVSVFPAHRRVIVTPN